MIIPASPGPGFVYIGDSWRWNQRAKSYKVSNGHWVKPRRSAVWVDGHWFKLVADGGMHKGIGGNIEKALRHTSMDMSSYNQKGQLISSHHQWNLLITTKS